MLTKDQKTILETIFSSELKKISAWGGGTALSEVYLHHRKSEDIDIILTDLPDETELALLSKKIKEKISAKSPKSFVRMNRFQYVFITKNSEQKLEFVYYPFPKLAPARKIGLIKAESLKDIAVCKILSSYQRNEAKDAYDLYIILKRGEFILPELIKGVKKKFEEEVDTAILLVRLTKSLENFSALKPMLYKDCTAQEIADFYQKELDKFLESAKM